MDSKGFLRVRIRARQVQLGQVLEFPENRQALVCDVVAFRQVEGLDRTQVQEVMEVAVVVGAEVAPRYDLAPDTEVTPPCSQFVSSIASRSGTESLEPPGRPEMVHDCHATINSNVVTVTTKAAISPRRSISPPEPILDEQSLVGGNG